MIVVVVKETRLVGVSCIHATLIGVGYHIYSSPLMIVITLVYMVLKSLVMSLENAIRS